MLHQLRVHIDIVVPDDRYPTTGALIDAMLDGSMCVDNVLGKYLEWAEENQCCTTCTNFVVEELNHFDSTPQRLRCVIGGRP